MAALAVAVVDHCVEDGEPPQPGIVRVDQQGRPALTDLGLGDGLPALPGSSSSTSASSGGSPDSPSSPSASVRGVASIHSWHMPSPYGPSLSTVGGTRPQPVASDISYAATSRRASVPSGKSHRGCSPATGL